MPARLQLSNEHLDALREMANIGCGHAVTALSKLIGGRRVSLSVPRAIVADAEQLTDLVGGRGADAVTVIAAMTGTLEGVLVLLMPAASAEAVAAWLLGSLPAQGLRAEEAASAICEMGNVLGSACLSAIGTALRLRLMPSVPALEEGRTEVLLARSLRSGGEGGKALVLQSRFCAEGDKPVEGHLLLMPSEPSLPALLSALRAARPSAFSSDS